LWTKLFSTHLANILNTNGRNKLVDSFICQVLNTRLFVYIYSCFFMEINRSQINIVGFIVHVYYYIIFILVYFFFLTFFPPKFTIYYFYTRHIKWKEINVSILWELLKILFEKKNICKKFILEIFVSAKSAFKNRICLGLIKITSLHLFPFTDMS
jgi:hypothetical protein